MCEECETTAQGSADALVEQGWNWADARTNNGEQLGFALCPDHSQDEDILDPHLNAYEDRMLLIEAAGAGQKAVTEFDETTGGQE